MTGPRGSERYHHPRLVDQINGIFQNNRWQVIIGTECCANPPRWYLLNYGRGAGFEDDLGSPGPGPYSIHPIFLNLDDVPGFIRPPNIVSNHGNHKRTWFHSLDDRGFLTGTAYFDDVEYDPTPGVDPGGDSDVILISYAAPFTMDIGRNPYFTPEPGSIILAGLGLLGAWRLKRRFATESMPANLPNFHLRPHWRFWRPCANRGCLLHRKWF